MYTNTATLPLTPPADVRRYTGRPSARTVANRRRLLIITLMLILVVGVFVGAVDADTGPTATVEHRVAAGETLWAVARELTEPGEDVRVTVRQLMDLNELSDSGLHVGQVLLLPTDG